MKEKKQTEEDIDKQKEIQEKEEKREREYQDRVKKIMRLLEAGDYVDSYQLSSKSGMSRIMIYRLIRKMRIDGIGIIPTKRGYILSEFAQLTDDVSFVRRCLGRRTSDIIAMGASKKDILSRWYSIPDGKNNLTPLISHLTAPITIQNKAQKGLKFMLSHINNKGV